MSLKTDLIAGGALLAALGGAAGAIYWSGRHAGAAAERPHTAVAEAAAATAAAQARSAAEAARIADQSAARTQTIIVREGDHRAAILASPGAGAPLDPRLLSAARLRLCEYRAYSDDPACALLLTDAAKLPHAGPAGGPAAP